MRRAAWLALLAALLAVRLALLVVLIVNQPLGLVRNGRFDLGTGGWLSTANLSIEARDGHLCTAVPAGTVNSWDAALRTEDLHLLKGGVYAFSFRYSGDPDGPVRAVLQMPAEPYDSYVELTPRAAPLWQDAAKAFKSPVDIRNAQILFQLGGAAKSWTFCLDDVSLTDGASIEAYRPDTGPRVRINQLGYLPDGPKRATLVTDRPDPVPFTVTDATGATVFTGMSVPRGKDASAGRAVQTLDFTAMTATGDGFTLTADGETSYPFAVRSGLYAGLLRDAVGYYYPARSGIAIDDAVRPGYGRPAGHVSRPGSGDLNQGDLAIPCQSLSATQTLNGAPWACDYTLDVEGGWYDAGDHGKYVVNGAISAAQLMATYERDQRSATPSLGDGTLAIPESANGVPDVLDEARWELDWFLRMIVPSGQPFAGMVHHAVSDDGATGIPLLPSNDPKARELRPPSTAATLDFAAAAAQGARLYGPYDADFASRLLAAARTSYDAAKATPNLFASAEGANSGGSAYVDGNVSDEFYWAAAELFITTGDAAYLADLKASPLWTAGGFRIAGFDWARTGGFAQLELAAHRAALPPDDAATVTRSVLAAADRLLVLQAAQPFGQPYGPADGKYEWGSNQLLLNGATVLAAASDLTGEPKYRDGALEAVDYVLGRNALNQSYITGYGAKFSHQQHSRWFAHEINADFPPPPNGALAGGPNSSIQDPVVQSLFADTGCAPQLCYVDEIQAWSVNEIAINWNAALGQMAEWLASQ